MSDRLAEIEARLSKVTPGPWERGYVWAWAGVMPERFGDGCCAYCAGMGEPTWVGQANINGKMMLAHKHRDPEPYATDHIISAPDGEVCGNYDYEAGGVINAEDAALIAAAPQDLRDLLAVAKAARDVLASLAGVPMRHQPLGSTRCCNTCGAVWPCEVDRLRTALANLEGGA